jgi:hypothetical protein
LKYLPLDGVHGAWARSEVFWQGQFTYLDADDPNTREFQRALGFVYQPEFYLLDGQGNLLKKWVGFRRSRRV